jgi:hypothetical protein
MLVTPATLSAPGVLAVVAAGLAAGAGAAALLWHAVAHGGEARPRAVAPAPPTPGPPAKAPPWPPPHVVVDAPAAAAESWSAQHAGAEARSVGEEAPPAADDVADPAPSSGGEAQTPGSAASAAGVTEAPASAPPPGGTHQHLYNAEYSEQLHRLDLLRVRIATHLAAGTPEHANGHPSPPPEPPPDDRR